MKRTVGAALAALLIVPVAGIAARAAVPGGTPGPGFAAVGPVSATDGYPVWYKDKNGLRVERCVAAADPRCPARGPLPDETAPVSFPDNYPDESFYALASANLTTGNGGKATIGLALESAFASGPVVDGDQVTFARVRIKFTNAKDGTDYRVTTPAGVKTLQTNGKTPGLVFDTEDIGIGGKGDFSGALGGRLGPFLTWDTFGSKSDPALLGDTYIGDGVTPHKIKGSPFGTNVVRIEGPGINPSATTDACPTVPGPFSDCVETDLFTIQGKVATTAGVTAEQAAYARSSGSGGVVDVYATSDSEAQAIQVSDAGSGTAFAATAMKGQGGHYFARVAYSGAPPASVKVTNTGDVPPSVKTIAVTDRVVASASYDNDSHSLFVTGSSSDTSGTPALTATGWGPLAGGTLTATNVDAPPSSVTVTSSAGGSLTVPVLVTGAATPPVPITAMAGPDQSVQPGAKVTLDGTASSGGISSYAWDAPSGISLTGAGTATPSFTAPTTPGDYLFTLRVSGPAGSATADVTVTVQQPAATVTASAKVAAFSGQRGTLVTLDGSASTGAATFTWTQTVGAGDPVVTLTGADTARPTFTFPLYRSPASNGPLHFLLTIASSGGATSTATVDVTPVSDTVVVTAARLSSGKWRVDGTSSVLGGQTVTAHLGSLTGPVIGSGPVDITGAFSIRPASGPTATTGSTVVVESTLGGVSTPFTVRIG